jgi:hypothetical protein
MNAIAWTGTAALAISVLGQLQLLEYHLLVQQKVTERMLSRLRVNIDVNTGTVERVCPVPRLPPGGPVEGQACRVFDPP